MRYSSLLKTGVVFASTGGALVLLKGNLADVGPQSRSTALAATVFPATSSVWNDDWDKRASEKSKCTRNIILVRHGQYHMDGKSQEEKRLTELGREQAVHTGMRLKDLGLDKKLNLIVESTMTRAHETCDLIYKQLDNNTIPVESSDLLREGAPIEPEPSVEHWSPSPKTFFLDGSRIEHAFRRYIHRADPDQEQESYELIVCHGNVIRYFVCRALQLPPEAWLRMSLRHASITHLSIRPSGRVSIKCLGDSGHLPSEKLTFE
ncbi:serine/threonine-protein phosphatase PGAM5, mitochondrial-like [Clavelina lepadiformis]